MSKKGQVRRTLQEEPEVSFLWPERPSLDYHAAGQRMTGAAVGAVGIKEGTMRTAIPSLVGFANVPWNKGRLIGQKRPLKPKEVWAVRVRLQLERRRRDLALFNLAIDSTLRGCDLVRLRVSDVLVGGEVRDRATVI
jgi:hypothetical protein